MAINEATLEARIDSVLRTLFPTFKDVRLSTNYHSVSNSVITMLPWTSMNPQNIRNVQLPMSC
jgi:hypothetical protein